MIEYKNIDDFFEHMDSITSEHIYEESNEEGAIEISCNRNNCIILIDSEIKLNIIVDYKLINIDIEYIRQKYNYYAFYYGFQRAQK